MKKLVCLAFSVLLFWVAGCGTSTTPIIKTPLGPLSAPANTTAVLGVPYSATMTETGGVLPYTWSIGSATVLPPGLTINAQTGLISGTPTQPGLFTVQVVVTDSASPSASAFVSFGLDVADAGLAVTTTSLAPAVIGVAYSQTLTAAGGYGAYTWTLASGTLPAGLSLSSSGVISGTPTAASTSSLTIKVTDAAGSTASATLILTVSSSTLAVATTSLPGATLTQSYSQTLAATGGSGSGYVWTLASGSLPSGLTLSSAGVISGTPIAAGSFVFTVEVTDSAGNTAKGNLAITVSTGVVNTNAWLQGQYFFQIDVWNDGSGSTPPQINHAFYAGSLIFDGAGNISSGWLDYADDNSDAFSGAVTGTYSIGSDGRGMMTIGRAGLGSYTYAIAVPPNPASGAVASEGRLVEVDLASSLVLSGQTNYASGFLRLQDTSAFVPASLQGASVFGLSGDTNIFAGSVLPQTGGLSMAGRLDVLSTLQLAGDSTADIATNQASDSAVPLAGSIEADATSQFSNWGRALLHLSSTTYPDGVLPAESVVYVIDANTAYVLSAPASYPEPLLTGELRRQLTNSFNAASLSGAAVIYGSSQDVGGQANQGLDSNGVSYGGDLYGSSDVYAGLFSFDGAGNFNLTLDANLGGNEVTAQPAAGTYTVSSSGRVTFDYPGLPVMWLSNTGAGFGTTQSGATGRYPARLTLEPQTAVTLSGTYTAGSALTQSYESLLFSGWFDIAQAGSLGGVLDLATDPGIVAFGANPITATGLYEAGANGRGNLILDVYAEGGLAGLENLVVYVISPEKAVALEADGSSTPSLILLEQ